MQATLLGITTHQTRRGEIAEHNKAQLQIGIGLNDYRGNKSAKHCVTIFSLHSWQIACQELGIEIPWQKRRANLLVDKMEFSEADIGRKLQVGKAILKITCETDPCYRMEEVAVGLEAALTPYWRGGARCEVIQAGEISIGDAVNWVE